MQKLETVRTHIRPSEPVEVVVYRITGRQGPISIPHRYCEECDLTVAAAQRAIAQVDSPSITLKVKPWFLHFWRPLLRGGWHAPILTINGEIYSQGVVPSSNKLAGHLRQALQESWRSVETTQRVS